MEFNFEKLDVYNRALSLASNVYSVTKSFPEKEVFGLTAQFRRASVSISLNIAEGSAKSIKDFRRFLDMARGSVFECVAISKIASNEQYISKEDFKKFQSEFETISKMISGLKRSLISQNS